MEDSYPTVDIKIIGQTAPCKYAVSLEEAVVADAATAPATDVRTGICNTIEEVIACFEMELPEWLADSIRDNLRSGRGVRFNLKEAYAANED